MRDVGKRDGDGQIDVLIPMRDHCQDPQDHSACWVVLQADAAGGGTFEVIDTKISLDPNLDWLAQETAILAPVRAIQVADVDATIAALLCVAPSTASSVATAAAASPRRHLD